VERFLHGKIKKEGCDIKEAVDKALCLGWIDGIRKNINENSYAIRFYAEEKENHLE